MLHNPSLFTALIIIGAHFIFEKDSVAVVKYIHTTSILEKVPLVLSNIYLDVKFNKSFFHISHITLLYVLVQKMTTFHLYLHIHVYTTTA
nr:MAG TPA: hypothetical protein [Caudoviricetes sp.]